MVWGLGLILASVVAFACAVQFVVKVGFKKVSVGFMFSMVSYATLSCTAGLIILTIPGGECLKGLIFNWAGTLMPLVDQSRPFSSF